MELIDTAVLTSGVSGDGKFLSLLTSLAIRDDSGLDVSSRGNHTDVVFNKRLLQALYNVLCRVWRLLKMQLYSNVYQW